MPSPLEPAAFLGASLLAAFALAARRRASLLEAPPRAASCSSPAAPLDDAAVVARLRALVRTTPRPLHSDFLVAAALVYEDAASGALQVELGVNSETCVLTSAICAERCALLQLRLRPHGLRRLRAVFVTATSAAPITPGLLCREMLMELPGAREARVVLFNESYGEEQEPGAAAAPPARVDLVLGALYPLPPLYHGVPRAALLAHGGALARAAEPFAGAAAERARAAVLAASGAAFPAARLVALFEEALTLARRAHAADQLYPISRAAAVLFADGSSAAAREDKGLEFGTTLDCVVKLALVMQKAAAAAPVLLVAVDQLGLCCAPSAVPRAWLSEHLPAAAARLAVAAHDAEGRLRFVAASELCPQAPAIELGGGAGGGGGGAGGGGGGALD
jgi:cytidine deaminase